MEVLGLEEQKKLAYAIAYLENKIAEHEEFLDQFNGNKTELAQYSLVQRYKEELKQLEYEYEMEE